MVFIRDLKDWVAAWAFMIALQGMIVLGLDADNQVRGGFEA
ncbi:MAG: hypothetical protein ACJZ56_08805 [Candidatus Thalassarchaeaceae archaeon]